MNILDTIIEHKRSEVIQAKAERPVGLLEKSALFVRQPLSLRSFLAEPGRTGIIAEFKRRSPSKGIINEGADVVEVTSAYAAGGAAALSVLTDQRFFGGSHRDLEKARVNPIPILRKDFVIDEYQVIEARAIGADVILLIAACLTPAATKGLAVLARSLGMEVLLEIHNEEELGHICDETEIIGINNRDLKTFTVDTDRSIQLSKGIPAGKITIAESGISRVDTILYLKQHGFSGFLIGENFMKEKDPAAAFGKFVNELNELMELKDRRRL
jgi:indole-3-glycerol phosphate synthase